MGTQAWDQASKRYLKHAFVRPQDLTFAAVADAISKRKFVNLQHLTLWAGYNSDHSEETFDPTRLTFESADDVDSSVKTLRHLTALPQLTTLHPTGCHAIREKIFQDLPPVPVLSDFST